ncbi:DegT/DnrJ/EryC1/StrS family aminotransferase [Streptomyces sp. NPDC017979]|uniref:DegT/DnrJ/EryC1/StrS family aminotransferase n=1 Tax=Streptomyces sp. NPDC017979 TaxID=3365024 RepID=UPI0037AE5541
MGATYQDREAGTLAETACLSFHRRKDASSDEGSALIATDPAIAADARLRSSFEIGSIFHQAQVIGLPIPAVHRDRLQLQAVRPRRGDPAGPAEPHRRGPGGNARRAGAAPARGGPGVDPRRGRRPGIYSALWLEANAQARSTQLDWEPINTTARELLEERGPADRFTCHRRRLPLHRLRYGALRRRALHSHIAHQEGPEENTEVFTRLRRAIKPGGALVVCDDAVDDRSGPAFPPLFASEMLLKPNQGGTRRRSDHRDWLLKAGFGDVSYHSAPPATLAVAR